VDSTVDKKSVEIPKVLFTHQAKGQLALIIENDFTLAGKYFRLLISGKGCSGFDYSVGFTELHPDDFIIAIDKNLEVILDPFTAFYLQDCTVEYSMDQESHEEGFIVTNNQQKEFSGKFWKSDETKVPETVMPVTPLN
jgi:Fe-S cluster assembly iron-binding protein IscA